MTVKQFAMAVGVDPKWIHNAAQALGCRFTRTLTEARWLRLAHLIHEGTGMPLARAASLAREAIGRGGAACTLDIPASTDGSLTLELDLDRFESSFAAAATAALAFGGERRRGRASSRPRDPIAAAQAHGVDVGLVLRSLAVTAGERLARLDEDRAFLVALRKVSS
jgi:hypothetical protein